MNFHPTKAAWHVGGTLAGWTNLASGRYAIIEDGLGFSLVAWQPVLDQHIGRRISGLMHGDGGVEWHSGRKLGPAAVIRASARALRMSTAYCRQALLRSSIRQCCPTDHAQLT
jgi:hypothetical protein